MNALAVAEAPLAIVLLDGEAVAPGLTSFVTLWLTVAAEPVFVIATAATVSNVGLPATLPVFPRPLIVQAVVAEIVLHEIEDEPEWEVLVRPRPSNEPLTVYFVTEVALFVPSLTEIE